jgi:hypothetical protein
MTYCGVAELLVHLNTFSIKDSYSDGVYKLRMSMYYEKPLQVEDMAGMRVDLKEQKVE